MMGFGVGMERTLDKHKALQQGKVALISSPKVDEFSDLSPLETQAWNVKICNQCKLKLQRQIT
jgi:hypothetical protein